MIIGFFIQDTLKQKIIYRDTLNPLSDTAFNKNMVATDSSVAGKLIYIQPVNKKENSDTLSASIRNSIADVTFSDPSSLIFSIDGNHLQNFPFIITEINRLKSAETRTELIRHLRSGNDLPENHFKNDWALPLILFSVFIYGLLKAESEKFFRDILKFVSLRGIKESTSRDIGFDFQWQSTLFNLASFIGISLFAFFTSAWYDVFPFDIPGLVYWLILFVIIISAFTIRHFICIVTGNMSGEKEVFREYLAGIYQAYRLAGLFLLLLSILISYTAFVPVNSLFYTGLFLVSIIYLLRVIRLFLIFINRHVSIFYLILYLCALEILPVVILVKYVTGLV